MLAAPPRGAADHSATILWSAAVPALGFQASLTVDA
jgi:hypothetical protein